MPFVSQSLNDVDSGTGFGQFDLQLVQGANLLNVTIKMYFIDGRTNPTTTLATFVHDMAARVREKWNNKIQLRSAAGETVTVRFILQQSVAQGGSHFSVIVLDGNYGAGSGLKFATAGGGGDPCGVGANNIYLELKGIDNVTYAVGGAANLQAGVTSMERAGALMAARDAVVNAAPGGVQAFNVNLLRQAGGNWIVDPVERPALNQFCASIVNTPQWLVQPPLLVTSQSGIQTKADALVQCVEQYIRGQNVTGNITTNATKVRRKFRFPGTAHKAGASVHIQVLPHAEMVKAWQSDYVVSAHEFGHCFGVPDEYLDYSTFANATIRNSQPLWDGLCTAYGAPQRNWHSQFNGSLMSLGSTVYPAHGVTICNGLDTMTQAAPNNMPAGSWNVV